MALPGDEISAQHRRLLLSIIVMYIALFLIVFFYGVAAFPAKAFLPTFRSKWTVNIGLIRFMAVLPTLHCSLVVFSYSLLPPSGFKRTESLSRRIKGAIVIFLVFTVVYTTLLEGAEPRARRTVSQLEQRTVVSRAIFDNAKSAYDEGRLEESRALLQYYREIDPGSREAAALYGQVTEGFARAISDESQKPDPAVPAPLLAAPAVLIERAREYLRREDPFSGYYYANLVRNTVRASAPEWADADRIALHASHAIEALDLSTSERMERELYATKRRGLDAASSLDPERNIEAYYIFEQLSGAYPEDSEVARYLREATARIVNVSFFTDDAERILPMPGTGNVMYANSVAAENGTTEIITLGKVVWIEDEIYVARVEVLGISPDGGLAYHIRAPLGQIIQDVLVMRGIDRRNASVGTNVEIVSGESPTQFASLHPLSLNAEELDIVQIDAEPLSDFGFFRILEMSETLPDYGYDAIPLRAAALDRLSAPFTFFFLSLFSAAVGLRFRPRRGRPPAPAFVFVPVLPLVVYGCVEIYFYGIRILNVFFAASMALPFSIAAAIAVQSVVIIIALAIFAGNRE